MKKNYVVMSCLKKVSQNLTFKQIFRFHHLVCLHWKYEDCFSDQSDAYDYDGHIQQILMERGPGKITATLVAVS